MHFHIQVTPVSDYRLAREKITARAAADARVVHLTSGRLAEALVFCEDAAEAQETQEEYSQSETVSQRLALVRIGDNGFIVDQECVEESREVMIDFVKWVLQSFAPCKVFDLETQEDLSDVAAKDADVLFE